MEGSTVSQLDAAEFLDSLESDSVQLLWSDPPFGTGKKQELESTWGKYGHMSYMDGPPLVAVQDSVALAEAAESLLTPSGVFCLVLDYRAIHEAVVAIRTNTSLVFGGEIIWHFELGGVAKSWWTNKHNTIAMFHRGSPKFHLDQVPHVERRAKRGDYTSDTRRANSVWARTMGPLASERTGYPTQKPLSIIEPFVLVHSDEGELVVDPYCGSGSVGEAAGKHDRRFALNDISAEAVAVTMDRLVGYGCTYG